MSTNYAHVWRYDPALTGWVRDSDRLTVSAARKAVNDRYDAACDAAEHGVAFVALSPSRVAAGDPLYVEGARIVPTPIAEPVGPAPGPDYSRFPFTAPEFHPTSPDAAVEPDLFRTVAYADAAFEAARTELVGAVAAARKAGATWTGIGTTLGITRQGASQRFGASVAELTSVVLSVAGDEIAAGARS